MSQVVLTGRLESIEDGFGEAIFRERIADEDERVGWVLVSHSHNILRIRTTKGKEALELALNNKPDVIVLDIILPDIDGGEVASLLSKTNALSLAIVCAHDCAPPLSLKLQYLPPHPHALYFFDLVISSFWCQF